MGAAGDRHHPRLHRHGRRPADRRLLQPGPLVRPGPGRQRVGRRLALPGRPDRRLAARRRASTASCSSRAACRRPNRRSTCGRRSETRRPATSPPSSALRSAEAAGPDRPGGCSSLGSVRRVTFSRNYTLSLSRTCQCYCKYCAFATHQAHIHAPEEVEQLLDEALKRNAKELLVLTGERPEVNPVVAAKLAETGATRTSPPTSSGPANGRWSGGCFPTRTSASSISEDLARLREVTASQGLMLESISERLMETVHAGSPTKHPAARLATIEAAGELKIPFTSGILVGIGETREERVESLEALAALPRAPRPPARGDPPELRPAPALLRRRGSRHRRRGCTRALAGRRGCLLQTEPHHRLVAPSVRRRHPRRPSLPTGRARSRIDEIKRLIQECKRLMPDVGVQVPPNLSDWWPELVEAGATDLGGLSANGDHISPGGAVPEPAPGAEGAGAAGVTR